MWKSVPTGDKSVSFYLESLIYNKIFNLLIYLQRWVHKAKRLLEREGLDSSSLSQTKVPAKKTPSKEIIESLMDNSINNK